MCVARASLLPTPLAVSSFAPTPSTLLRAGTSCTMKRTLKGAGSCATSTAKLGSVVGAAYLAAEEERHDAQAVQTLLDASRRVRGEDHAQTLELKQELAGRLTKMGRRTEAANLMAEVAAGRQRTLGALRYYHGAVVSTGAEPGYGVMVSTGAQPRASEKSYEKLASTISEEDVKAMGVVAAVVCGGWLGWKLLRAIVDAFRE